MDGDGGRIAQHTVRNGVGEGLAAGEVGVRRIEEGVAGIDQAAALIRHAGRQDRKAVAFDIAVVAQHGQRVVRCILGHVEDIVHGRGRIVERGDRDVDGSRSKTAVPIGDHITEGFYAVEVEGRGVNQGAAVVDHRTALVGGVNGEDGQGIAVEIAVVSQHIQGGIGAVFADGEGVIAGQGGAVDGNRGLADRAGHRAGGAGTDELVVVHAGLCIGVDVGIEDQRIRRPGQDLGDQPHRLAAV